MNATARAIAKALDVDRALALSFYCPPGGVKDNGVHADTRETTLAALHKIRITHWRHFTNRERAVSRQWLIDNDWKVPK